MIDPINPKFNLVQENPTVWEAEDDTPVWEITEFLNNKELPDLMNFGWKGNLYVFRTKTERFQWVLGLNAGYDPE